MALELQVEEKGGAPRIYVVRKDAAFFGRREDNDLVLKHTFVSSRHGRVLRRGGELLVEDMGSTNGTTVNGQPLTPMVPQPLKPTDAIEIETVVIRARLLEGHEDSSAPPTYHEEALKAPALENHGETVRLSAAASAAAVAAASHRASGPSPAAFPSSPVAAPAAPAASAPAPLADLAPLPAPLGGAEARLEAPATMWELQTGTALSAAAREESAEAAAPTRLGQASLPDVLATGRMMRQLRAAEEGDSFLLWEIAFKALGVLAVVGGLVLMVMIFVA